MKITLRKACAVQAAIVEAVEKLNFEPKIEINEFQRPEEEILKAYDNFIANGDRREALLDALYEIRKSVAKANAGTSGVSDLLADIARVDKDIRFYSYVDRVKPRLSNDVLVGKLAKLKEQSEKPRSIYGGSDDSVGTTIFDETDLDVMRQSLQKSKKQKQKLQDALLEANIRNEIELSEAAEATLVNEDLV